ncbi:MAG: flagellar hook-length control protein FliK [Spirochaetaceae bacterium]|nr:flagellar hook-length control protein FliK [Spirochaetaceae bacterium]
MLNTALFNTSGFSLSQPTPPGPALTSNSPSFPPLITSSNQAKPDLALETSNALKFSDYLAAVAEKAPPKEETAAPPETAEKAGEDERAEDVKNDEDRENYLAAASAASHGAAANATKNPQDLESAGEADLKTGETLVKLDASAKGGGAAEAAEIPPETEEMAQTEEIAATAEGAVDAEGRRPHKTGKHGAPEAGGEAQAEKAADIPVDSENSKPLNAEELADEKKTTSERIALEADDSGGVHGSANAAGKKQERGEGAARASPEGENPAAALAAAGTRGASPAKGSEREGEGKTSARKKQAVERVKHRAEHSGQSAVVFDGSAARPAEGRDAPRVNAGGTPETEIVVNMRTEARSTAADGREGFSNKMPASFENFLARELQQNLGGDIVRQAQILLREGGEGTIRLSLRPESLGKVKIHLEMAENKVTGKIVVESGEALRAFEHELASLEETFRSEGFDGANLSLELEERPDPRNSEDGRQAEGAAKFSVRTASSRYDGAVDKVTFIDAAYSTKQVNVLI